MAEVLRAHKVKYVFTLVGGHISPILVACEKLGIRIVDTRHEATAVFAADAVARLSGVLSEFMFTWRVNKIAVCSFLSKVCLGVGLGVTNSINSGWILLVLDSNRFRPLHYLVHFTESVVSVFFFFFLIVSPPGTVGVAAVTAGPGLTNTVTAVKNAQMAESPLLLIGGAAGTLLQVDSIHILKQIRWECAGGIK